MLKLDQKVCFLRVLKTNNTDCYYIKNIFFFTETVINI